VVRLKQVIKFFEPLEMSRRILHPVLHCIDGWEDWSMPGNSLALQMPPAHQPENFDHSIPIAIPNYYIYSRLSDSGSHLREFPL